MTDFLVDVLQDGLAGFLGLEGAFRPGIVAELLVSLGELGVEDWWGDFEGCGGLDVIGGWIVYDVVFDGKIVVCILIVDWLSLVVASNGCQETYHSLHYACRCCCSLHIR